MSSPALTPLALRLEPRAHPARVGQACAAMRLEVSFLGSELPASDLARLEGTTSLRLSADEGERVRLTGPTEVLGELDDPAALPGLHVLLDAQRNATRPSPPPRVLGVLNVTPDSFSDGGRFLDPNEALAQAQRMAEGGADLLDVGGESTRPGSQGVDEEEELGRVLPVIEAIARAGLPPISIDTTKSRVARAALDAGATLVNDVSAGRFDPAMLELVAERNCELILMHMLGRPRDMQEEPRYGDVVREVTEHLRQRAAASVAAGIPPERLYIDPGIGFGKTLEHNLALIRALPELRSLGLPIVLGVSRKRFLGQLTGTELPADRRDETLAAVTAGTLLGADVLRVHDVPETARALRVAGALRDGVPSL